MFVFTYVRVLYIYLNIKKQMRGIVVDWLDLLDYRTEGHGFKSGFGHPTTIKLSVHPPVNGYLFRTREG